jgi:4-hydroxybenzoate polyprenyltransferase/phosphoserine phosphatase
MTKEKEAPRIVYVDLDHTLLCIDLLRERLLLALFHEPLVLFRILFWLFCGGRARLKTEFAARHSLDVMDLPFNVELLVFLRAQKAAGRSLVLATAAPRQWAEAVAAHLGLFDRVLATTLETGNLKARRKLKFILEDAKGEPFGYAGDAAADVPILEAAQWPIVVGTTARLAGSNPAKARVISRRAPNASPWWHALRMHQWSKNLLLLAPAVSAHQVLHVWPQILLAFGSFSSVSSALYLLNDLYDIDLDRKHPNKRLRPIPSGRLDPVVAAGLIVCLVGLAAILSVSLPSAYRIVLLCYAATNILYSKQFKRIPVLDITVLAFLYSIRIFAGGAACGIPVSTWLAALTFFLALSLAHLKRYVETMLLQLGASAPTRPAYRGEDTLWLATAGIGAGLTSVLVLALYITSAQTYMFYRKPQLLYIICILQFYWIERMWMLAYRGKMSSDPVAFIITDRNSYVLAAIVLIISYVAAA